MPSSLVSITASDAVLPRSILIDWTHLLKRRASVLAHSSLPPYLLLPEVRSLIECLMHANHRLLFSTLWHTGARVSEVLALTPKSFVLDGSDSYVSLRTLKQRGRPRGGIVAPVARMVPIRDEAYIQEIARYLATHGPKPGERLFPITRQAVDHRIRAAASFFNNDGGAKLSVPVSAHTFRHSFAVNAVLHGVPLTVLQAWLGHKNLQTTAIYTQVLAAETGHLMAWVSF